jgi:hypothetical protein
MVDEGIFCLLKEGLVIFVESFEKESEIFDEFSLYDFYDAGEF